MRTVLGWTLGLALAAAPGQALSPYLVKDINPTATPASSTPRSFVPVGNVVAFLADNPFTGTELWRSDGTAKGTYPLITGCDNCFFQWYDLTPSSAFFFGYDRSGGFALWVTSGTPATTLPLVSGLTVYESLWVPEQGLYYFTADDGVHGRELWRTDRTVPGTFMVTDLVPGAASSRPSSLTDFGGELFFTANDGSGAGLWKTDGTARGTQLVKNVLPGEPPSLYDLAIFGIAGRRLVFAAYTRGRGYKLWRSDGTTRGTVPLHDLLLGAGSASFDGVVSIGERLLFAADTGHGANLWVTDGTNPGTRQLTHYTSPQPFDPNYGLDHYRIVTGGRLFFPADDGVHGRELWTSDGTPAGTHLVSDVCPGPCSSNAFPDAVAAGRLFFIANDGVHGYELWSTDGTSGGTRLLKDLCPGSCNSYASVVAVFGNRVVLAGEDGRANLQLWSTDGTASGTTRITGFGAFSVFPVVRAVAGGSILLFPGADAAHGTELWRSDGTRAGTYLLKDIATEDIGGSGPSDLHAAGARSFFFANDGVHGDALWTSDGTASGTALASTFGLAPGSAIGPPSGFQGTAAVGETLFFGISVQENSSTLWKSDGTRAGTQRLTADGVNTRGEVAAVGGTVFFTADDGVHGPALWKSDGTPAATVPVDPVAWSGGGATLLTPFQGKLFFFLAGGDGNEHLWRSDGTPNGTVHVADTNAPSDRLNPPLLTEFSGRLYFFAQDAPDANLPLGLWSTDGTTAGTLQASSLGLAPGTAFSPMQLAVAGNRLFIFGSTLSAAGDFVTELWVSDGTDAGTRLVQNFGVDLGQTETVDLGGRLAFIGPGNDPVRPTALWLSDGTAAGTVPLLDAGGHQILSLGTLRGFAGLLVYEAADTAGVNLVLWQTDGTPSGTVPVFTVSPLSYAFSNDLVNDLVVAGDRIFLGAYDPAIGEELWAMRP